MQLTTPPTRFLPRRTVMRQLQRKRFLDCCDKFGKGQQNAIFSNVSVVAWQLSHERLLPLLSGSYIIVSWWTALILRPQPTCIESQLMS